METQNQSMGNPPDNNLVWAILCTVMCCMPLGIVAIIKATKVNTLWYQGDHEGARQAAADAKKYSIWGAVSVGIFLILYLVLMVIFGIGASVFQ